MPIDTSGRQQYLDLLYKAPLGSIEQGEIRIIVDEGEANHVKDAIRRGVVKIHGKIRDLDIGIVYQDHYVMVVRDLVEFPGNEFGTYIRILPADTADFGVCVLPLLHQKVVLIKQFRHATRRWHLELVKGFSEPGETAEHGARRELLEEIGVHASSLEFMGNLFADVGLQGGRVQVFAAQIDDLPTGGGDYGSATVQAHDWNDVSELIKTRQIDDALTLASLQLYSTRST